MTTEQRTHSSTADAVRRHYARHDRVVLVTDEQAWGGWGGEDPTTFVPEAVPVYTFNLAGYRHGHGPSGAGNRHTAPPRVAQQERATAYEAVRCRFESCHGD